MANAIVESIEKIGTTVAEYQQTNDQRLDELKKGNDARARDLEAKLDKMDKVITELQDQKKQLEQLRAADQARIEILEAAVDRPKGTPLEQVQNEYKSTFFGALRQEFKDPSLNMKLRDLQAKQAKIEGKDVTIGSTSGGGYGVPKEIAQEVNKLVLSFSDIAANVKNVNVGTSDYQELVSIYGGTSGWVSETGSRSATGTPNLRNCKPTWGELYAYPQISEWSIQDIQFDVQSWLTNDIADGMAVALSTAIWNGNGTNKPTGMTNTTPVTTADSASPMRAAAAYQYTSLLNTGTTPSSPVQINMDAILNLIYTVKPTYRNRAVAKFAMNSITQGGVRRLKTSQGVYLWEPSLQMGQPDLLVGYPVFTWEDMGNHNTNDAFSVAFGDFRRAYTLASRTELNITVDTVTNPGYTRFYVRRRFGGIPTNNDAVKFLRIAD